MPIIINNIKVLITGVNYILNIKNTLISSKELTNKGQSIYFNNNIVIIQNNNFTFKANQNINNYYIDLNIDYNLLKPM